MNEGFIDVQYTCKPCKTGDRTVRVQARLSADENLGTWMDSVREAVGKDHAIQAPYCRSEVFDLKIPYPEGTEFVGQTQPPTGEL